MAEGLEAAAEEAPGSEPELKVRRRTPHTDELLRALIDRLRDLSAEFDDLIARRGDGAHAGTVGALHALRAYPEHMANLATSAANREGRPAPLASKLRGYSEQVVRATSRVQEWFGAPHSDEVPFALLAAVEAACDEYGIGERHAVISIGAPTRFETIIRDVRAVLYGKHLPEGAENGPQFALITIPQHEGMSARWWPLVLGHELAHLRIQHIMLDEQPPTELEPDLPDDVLASPVSSYFILQRLRILQAFPFADMRVILSQEIQEHVNEVTVEPPGLTQQLPLPPERDTADARRQDSMLVRRVWIANDWATELICDLVMARQFGPAAVAALGNYLVATGNFSVISTSHPPGYLRIRLLNRYLANTAGPSLSSIMAPWERPDDGDGEKAQPAWARRIAEYLDTHFSALSDEVDLWPGDRYQIGDDSREQAVVLAQRQLRFGVPPHDAPMSHFPETLRGSSRTEDSELAVITLENADIINAGWATVSAAGVPRSADLKRDDPTDRLVLKALEDKQLLTRVNAVPTPESRAVAGPARPPVPVTGGSVLGHETIMSRLTHPDLRKRLIVTPRIDANVGEASVDVRLGNRFITFQRTSTTSFNAVKGNNAREVQRYVERGWGTPFVLHPGEVVLASILEYVALPNDLSAQVITRSSYGRLGLITATAVQEHPQYRGCLTLELVNLGTVPLELYPGERIAQLVFLVVDRPDIDQDLELTSLRTYKCPTGPQFPSITVDPWVRATVKGVELD